MPKTDGNDFQELFRHAEKIQEEIRELRIGALPHVYLMMLHERAAELRKAMCRAARTLFRQRREAAARQKGDLAASSGKALSVLAGFFAMLKALSRRVAQDLLVAGRLIGHARFYADLVTYKKEIRALLASCAKHPPESGRARLGEILAAVSRLKTARDKLQSELNPKFASYYKTFDAIFSAFETQGDAGPWAGAHAALQAALLDIAYPVIASSYLFDKDFYLQQLPDAAAAPDCCAHYLSENTEGQYSPNEFFSDRHYLASYPEVRRLRYSALEHFMRYGEALNYDPFPEFDTRFYMENYDDVLDADVGPFRHFLYHGIKEGRPPSASPLDFFSTRYISGSGTEAIKLAFIGTPAGEADKKAWELLRGLCEAQAGVSVVTLENAPDAGSPDVDAYVFSGKSALGAGEDFLACLADNRSALIYFGSDPQRDLAGLLRQTRLPLTRICAISADYASFLRWQESELPLRLQYYSFDEASTPAFVVRSLFAKLRRKEEFLPRTLVSDPGAGPAISVASIIYKKSKELCAFLESLNRQDIAREYELILVDDASPDDSVAVVEQWLEARRASGLLNKFMRVSILRNESNLGNCLSRNKGIEAARADVVLVADGDMVFGASCLSEHVSAYRYGDCDVLMGFFHFNVNYEFIFDWLAACEINPQQTIGAKAKEACRMHDLFYPMDGIYNFVTRNVSLKKSLLKGNAFDPDFSYTSDPDSGYGEEDHDLAAGLYFAGRRMRFAASAFALHIRHEDSSYSSDKNLSNLKNWNRLIAKHPDLTLVDRQYYQWRTADFLQKVQSRPESREYIEAHTRYADAARTHIRVGKTERLKILTYRWHAAHQYELFKLGHSFTLVTGSGTAMCDQWDYGSRPLPYNAQFKPLSEIDAKDYDFAILPFDENILDPVRSNSILSPDWGKSFFAMLEFTRGMPRAAICHGTPRRYGDFLQDGVPMPENASEIMPAKRETLRALLKELHVVCNSRQAQSEWQFYNSSVIWHGFSPYEFPPGRHEKACLTLSEQAFAVRPLYRGQACLERVQALLAGVCTVDYTAPPAPHPGYIPESQEWAVAKFQNYARHIGEFAVYLAPTVNSPMPRSRGEAMMTGTIPVSLRNHDVDMFIQNGVNGFYGESAEELAEAVVWLMKNEKQRGAISRNARLTAMDLFNVDRYLAAWSELIASLR